jgi:hypothetical protein
MYVKASALGYIPLRRFGLDDSHERYGYQLVLTMSAAVPSPSSCLPADQGHQERTHCHSQPSVSLRSGTRIAVNTGADKALLNPLLIISLHRNSSGARTDSAEYTGATGLKCRIRGDDFHIPKYLYAFMQSRDSDWLWAARTRARSSSPGRVKNFHFSMSSRPALGPTQPPIQREPGALSPDVKRPGREADHSLPTSTEVKKTWIYTSTPPCVFMA